MTVDVGAVDLEVLKYAFMQSISKELVKNISVEVGIADMFTNQIGVRMVQRLAAKRTDETVVMASESVPVSWWSHLWLTILGEHDWEDHEHPIKATLRRWFIQTRDIATKTTFYRTCPHLDLPDKGLHVRWLLNVDDDKPKTTA
jgi:CRISPR/Cas system-associated exonuclease Cas4 (RecB family)